MQLMERMTAVDNGSNATGLLGYLVWYSIWDADISRDNLYVLLSQYGLDEFIPRPINPGDAFRRATNTIEQRGVSSYLEGVTENYLVREVCSNKDEIIRHIVVEYVDKKNQSLSYEPEMAVLKFDRASGDITCSSNSNRAYELAEKVKDVFPKCLTHYNGRHIREMVCNILLSLRPIPVRPTGGVYYVPKGHEDRLNNLISLVKEIGESEAHKVPLIDSAENKDMVRQKLNDHIKEAMQAAADFLTSGSENRAEGNKKLQDIKDILKGFKDYQSSLSLNMKEMNDLTGILQRQAATIIDRITEIRNNS